MSKLSSIIASLKDRFFQSAQIDDENLPLLENIAYLDVPDRLHSQTPFITADNFEYFVEAMGLTPPDGVIKAGFERTYPDPSVVKRPNGHTPLTYILTLHPVHEIVLASLCGTVTEMHVVIKRPPGSPLFQMDMIHVSENEYYYEMDCNKGTGCEDALPRFMAVFKEATANIIADPFSRTHDSELILAKSLRQIMIGQLTNGGPLPFGP